MPIVFNSPESKAARRSLRKNFTEPENKLWYYLRGRRFRGLKFRRQHAIGRYVVDFYCPQVRMAVEVDGDSHYTDEGRAYNTVRDEYLKNCNIFVIRFTNDEVMGNVEGVLDQIASYTSHLTRPATSGRPLLSKER